MAVSLEGKLARLPKERRAKIDARAAELIAEEMTLRDLRRALDRTQVKLAEQLGVKQETVSRLEKRSDMLLSTLRSYVEAMGGELDLLSSSTRSPVCFLRTWRGRATRGFCQNAASRGCASGSQAAAASTCSSVIAGTRPQSVRCSARR